MVFTDSRSEVVVWFVSLSEELMLNRCLCSIENRGLNFIRSDGSEEVDEGMLEAESVSSSSLISF